ncbi:hypothetical protein WJX74_002771 [Apatococcus lobatus]|uniref:Uncharacterized protein n=1 Tax=Apatococcus lobatus TaxID=904363 RepID=A0AAW1RQA6_9CHLO
MLSQQFRPNITAGVRVTDLRVETAEAYTLEISSSGVTPPAEACHTASRYKCGRSECCIALQIGSHAYLRPVPTGQWSASYPMPHHIPLQQHAHQQQQHETEQTQQHAEAQHEEPFMRRGHPLQIRTQIMAAWSNTIPAAVINRSPSIPFAADSEQSRSPLSPIMSAFAASPSPDSVLAASAGSLNPSQTSSRATSKAPSRAASLQSADTLDLPHVQAMMGQLCHALNVSHLTPRQS